MTDPLAQAAMVAYCGWDPTEHVTNQLVLLNGNGTSLLTLPSLHVTDVSAVTVTDRWDRSVDLTIGTGSADLSWSEDGVLSLTGCGLVRAFPEGLRNVAVTYSGGYPEVPAELQAVLDSIGKRTGTTSAGIRSKTMGKAAFTYVASGDLLLLEKMVLDRYRIVKSA